MKKTKFIGEKMYNPELTKKKWQDRWEQVKTGNEGVEFQMNQNTYDYKKTEKKWRKKWAEASLFEADRDEREKYFINFPIPYLNGPPHVGHGYTLLKAEAMARFQRMLGKNVLFPFALHATG